MLSKDKMLDLAVAIPTLVRSYLSMFVAGSVFICYLILPSQRHFRHTLIMNLAGAGERPTLSEQSYTLTRCLQISSML